MFFHLGSSGLAFGDLKLYVFIISMNLVIVN